MVIPESSAGYPGFFKKLVFFLSHLTRLTSASSLCLSLFSLPRKLIHSRASPHSAVRAVTGRKDITAGILIIVTTAVSVGRVGRVMAGGRWLVLEAKELLFTLPPPSSPSPSFPRKMLQVLFSPPTFPSPSCVGAMTLVSSQVNTPPSGGAGPSWSDCRQSRNDQLRAGDN